MVGWSLQTGRSEQVKGLNLVDDDDDDDDDDDETCWSSGLFVYLSVVYLATHFN
jgi:hypothetical protein